MFSARKARPESGINPAGRGRIELLDILRAVALLAMASYHFTWDLEFFGYVARGLTSHGAWRLYARGIASSFLFLVGISLVLAHGREIRWRGFWKRLAQIVVGALAVSAATHAVSSESFVYFGILHEIALASLLGLVFLRLPFFVTGLAGAAIIVLPFLYTSPLMDPKILSWIGFAAKPPLSNDYVPVFPWFGVVLLGLALGRFATDYGVWEKLRALNPVLVRLTPLRWLSRHSLLFYLLHQPILFGSVWAATQIAPPDPQLMFQRDCRASCLETQDERFCASYCGCAKSRLTAENLFDAVVKGSLSPEQTKKVRGIARQCSFSARP